MFIKVTQSQQVKIFLFCCLPDLKFLDSMLNLFQDVVYSNEKESLTFLYFNTFLHECEGTVQCQCLHVINYIYIAGNIVDVTLENILIFFTCCDRTPPLGFDPAPTLQFGTSNGMPRSSTCINRLFLPIHQSYDDFRRNMILGISNHGGFGLV